MKRTLGKPWPEPENPKRTPENHTRTLHRTPRQSRRRTTQRTHIEPKRASATQTTTTPTAKKNDNENTRRDETNINKLLLALRPLYAQSKCNCNYAQTSTLQNPKRANATLRPDAVTRRNSYEVTSTIQIYYYYYYYCILHQNL